MHKDFLVDLHTSTERDYFQRMSKDKPSQMDVAAQFEKDYWDGDRSHGYGGYTYDGRWKSFAIKLIEEYKLDNHSSVIDLGCGKAFLLYELTQLLPGITVHGIDISNHAIHDCKEDMSNYLRKADLNNPEIFEAYKDQQYDLAISLMTFHNLELPELETAIKETKRISKKSYIAVESYRNWTELSHLQCWALTCKSFFSPRGWEHIFKKCEFDRDYEFLFFS